MSDTLSLQARIAATPSKVFHALTDETAVTTWLAEHAAISLPEQHYGFWGDTTPQGDQTHQTLLSAEPDRLLRFSWTLDGTPTTVEIELQPDGSQTVLRLRQDGLPTLDELMAPTGRRDGLHSMHTFWGLALANLAEYTEGRPLTPKADFRPKRAPEIRVRMEIDATPHEVFESLIDPTQIARWFGWEVEIQPRLGGAVTLGAEGKIFEFEPDKTLAYSDDEGSITRWELEGTGGKTFLTFVQSGYTDDEWDNAAQHEAGWLGSLAELKRMHELGNTWTPLTTELPADDQPPSDPV
ncbi:MAG: SRPBCC domain-containing protein [Tessaracoccus sp.]